MARHVLFTYLKIDGMPDGKRMMELVLKLLVRLIQQLNNIIMRIICAIFSMNHQRHLCPTFRAYVRQPQLICNRQKDSRTRNQNAFLDRGLNDALAVFENGQQLELRLHRRRRVTHKAFESPDNTHFGRVVASLSI